MRRHRDVAEQVVTVFGATDAIGRAVVRAAVDRRARVSAASDDARALDVLAAAVDAPHRFQTVPVGSSGLHAVEQTAYATTTRFGLLHTWVHVLGRGDATARSLDDVTGPVLRELRRSGGGALVVVATEPRPGSHDAAELGAQVGAIDAHARACRDLASVSLVRATGAIAPERVARTVLAVAMRPRTEVVLRGATRRDALVARFVPVPLPARTRTRPAHAFGR